MQLPHNLHDKLFRKSLSNIKIAKDFLITYLPPQILAKIDISTIESCQNSFIEPTLQEQLWSIIYNNIPKKNNYQLYLAYYIIMEKNDHTHIL